MRLWGNLDAIPDKCVYFLTLYIMNDERLFLVNFRGMVCPMTESQYREFVENRPDLED